MSKLAVATDCPCSPDRQYASCCGIYHANFAAPSPETLMRSRYSAYVLGLTEYLLATWHSSTRPASLDLQDEPPRKWVSLEIKHHAMNTDDTGVVEYLARFKVGGRAYRLHETSRFVREQGRWFYRDGDIHE